MTALHSSSIPRPRWSLRILCQWVSLALIFVALPSLAMAASSGDHTFTDQQGRTLVAQIIRVVEPDVYLQSDNGQPFPVKVAVFIAKDQAYIQQWALEHQKTAEPFTIFALRNTLTDSSQALPVQGFNITLKNFSGADVKNLRVDYIVLRQPTQNAVSPLPRISGTVEITSIANKGEASFETDRIPAKGNRLAVWVRIYNSKGVLLQEWSSSPAMTRDEQWSPTADGSSDSSDAETPHGKSKH